MADEKLAPPGHLGGAEGQASEFDDYSDDYCGGCEVSFKRLLGRDLSSYVGVKAEWLLRDLARRR